MASGVESTNRAARDLGFGRAATLALAAGLLLAGTATAQPTLLDRGYREMYNLQFPAAHTVFGEWEKLHPGDPMGAVSVAAAYLFGEFDRLHILQSDIFTSDERVLHTERSLVPSEAAKRDIVAALERAQSLASAALAKAPDDENAMLATVLAHGLRGDYLSLIEKRNMEALSEVVDARRDAQHLLALHPDCYDAYLAVGIENYLLSLRSLPVRLLLRLGGAQSDKETGIADLRIAAAKGRYLLPFARLLLAIAAMRDKDTQTARQLLTSLASEFPKNDQYRRELAKLK